MKNLKPWKQQICAIHSAYFTRKEALQSLPLMHRETAPKVSSENIFLIESSCNPQPTFRTWCSVESWASQHPDKIVWFILVSPFINDGFRVSQSLLSQYSNIRVVTSDLEETFKETPLWDLFNSDKWLKKTSWPESNLSNMVRGALVWKWGGIYSDTDSICIRSTSKIANAVGMYEADKVNGAVLIGQPRHKVYWMLMEYIKQNFRGDKWGVNGPHAITNVMYEFCNASTFEGIAKSGQGCGTMKVLSPEAFYPIPYGKNRAYTQARRTTNLSKLFKDSYVLHFWNKLTKNTPVRPKGHSILYTAAKTFCPVTCKIATSHSNFF
ncbi:lactosylceramide 4-alpha-galactosyltransferase-like [Palaemon carinicauda]|uniref:lactosylceramide 4-alpha-galactosyltransferase-like n=1 Tax=Palaemon carinicauda TaxID=392227 RepID=UPI0035B6120B